MKDEEIQDNYRSPLCVKCGHFVVGLIRNPTDPVGSCWRSDKHEEREPDEVLEDYKFECEYFEDRHTMYEENKSQIVVITGSTNKFGEEIYAYAGILRVQGMFIIDDSMFHSLPEPIARKQFMRAILDADTLLVYNQNEYIGFHSQLEIAMAETAGVRIEYLFGGENPTVDDLSDLFYKWKGAGG